MEPKSVRSCSIPHCRRAAVRSCLMCQCALCATCWCAEEVSLVRQAMGMPAAAERS